MSKNVSLLFESICKTLAAKVCNKTNVLKLIITDSVYKSNPIVILVSIFHFFIQFMIGHE